MASQSLLVQKTETPEVSPRQVVVRIRPHRTRIFSINLAELWKFRELLYFLTWRDIKVRYKQTLLGVAWAILQPLSAMLIFTLFFGRLAGIPSDGVPYPIFAFAGLVPWTFFANAVTNGSNSLVNNANLITKIYFPRLLVPFSSIAAGLVDFFISFLLLIALMVYYHIEVTTNLLLLPVLIILIVLFAAAVSVTLASLNVKYRDIKYAVPVMVQLWMFVTPIIYPLNFVPAKWRWILIFNPLVGITDGFRAALFGREFNWIALGVSCLLTVASLIYATSSFRRMEKTFADIV